PLESLPGHIIEGSLFVPVGDDVLKRKLRVVPTGASLGASTHQLSFGETAVATPVAKTISYTNTGNLAVDLVASVQPSSAFTITSSSTMHLEPGDMQSFNLTFGSNAIQTFSSTLAITPNAPLCQQPLRGIPLDGAVTTDAILVDSLTIDYGSQ